MEPNPNAIKNLAEVLGLSEDQINIGAQILTSALSHLQGRVAPVVGASQKSPATLPIVKITNVVKGGPTTNVYAGVTSTDCEELTVQIGQDLREFTMYTGLSEHPDLQVVKGVVSGKMRAKDFYVQKDGRIFTKAYGTSLSKQTRHKFDANEAKAIANRLACGIHLSRGTWVLELRNREEAMLAWLALYGEV